MNIPLIVIGLLIVAYVFLFTGTNSVMNSETKINNVGGFTDKFLPIISSVKNAYPFDVPTPLILAIIKQESGNLFEHKQNSDILGDKLLTNKAYGFMQVRKPALQDVNNAFGLSLTEQDIKDDEQSNIVAGIGYLQLAQNAASLEGVENIVYSTAKKYNAGVGTKDNSFRGSVYASSVMGFYNFFNGVTV